MGIFVSFNGDIKIEPPLDSAEKEDFRALAATRHHEIDDFNKTKKGMPSLNCPWEATTAGDRILCALEKESSNKEWLEWLVKKFDRPGRDFSGSFSVVYEDLAPEGDAKEIWNMNHGVLEIKEGSGPQSKSAFAALAQRASNAFKALKNTFKNQSAASVEKEREPKRMASDKGVNRFLEMLITNYPIHTKRDFKRQLEKCFEGNVNQKIDGYGRVGSYTNGEPCFTSFENGTLLMAAASCGCTPAIMALIESGADVSSTDAKGRVALDYLRLRKHQGAEEEAFLMEKLTQKSLGEHPSPSYKRV